MLYSLYSFNGGEVSTSIAARPDLSVYRTCCRQLQNMLPLPEGGVQNRPGLVWIAEAKHADRTCRLIPFVYSTSTRYVVELGHEYVRFYSNGAAVGDEEVTPYQEDELFQVQFVQVNDIVYFCHPNHAPQRLVRENTGIGNSDFWTWSEINISEWPYLDENTDTTENRRLVFTGGTDYVAGEEITVEGVDDAAPVFKWDPFQGAPSIGPSKHDGSRWRVAWRREDTIVKRSLDSPGNTDELLVWGEYKVRTSGTWSGTVYLERQKDTGDWEVIKTINSANDYNADITDSVEGKANLRLRLDGTSMKADTEDARAILEALDPNFYGVFRIVEAGSAGGFGDSTTYTATAVIEQDLYVASGDTDPADTSYFRESAWNNYQGWPQAVSLFEARLWFGGTVRSPLTVWGSVLDDFENFRLGTNDDDSVSLTLLSPTSNRVQWMRPWKRAMLVGTAGEEFILQSTNESTVISPSNVSARHESSYGSRHLPAVAVGDSILFVQRNGADLRDYVFSFESDGYQGISVSRLARHLMRDAPISQLGQSSEPDPVIWLVAGDNLLSLTYDREQSVLAWAEHTTNGAIESVAVIPGEGDDEVWCVVRRTVDGGTVRYVERMDPTAWAKVRAGNRREAIFLDAAVYIDATGLPGPDAGNPTATISGLEHLEGLTVGVLADGGNRPDCVVTGGEITLDAAASDVVVGLRYVPLVETLPIVWPMGDAASMGRIVTAKRAQMFFQNTGGAEYTTRGADAGDADWNAIGFRSVDDATDSPPPLFTGIKDLSLGGGHSRAFTVAVRQKTPLPLQLDALQIEGAITENP